MIKDKTPIQKLNLPTRVMTVLCWYNKIRFVEDIPNTDEKILELEGVGDVSLHEIKRAINEAGLYGEWKFRSKQEKPMSKNTIEVTPKALAEFVSDILNNDRLTNDGGGSEEFENGVHAMANMLINSDGYRHAQKIILGSPADYDNAIAEWNEFVEKVRDTVLGENDGSWYFDEEQSSFGGSSKD